jgi:hypothetical protein
MDSEHTIRNLLQAFQDGYTRRDVASLDSFMALFTPTAEVIGTNGIRPGVDEWYRGRRASAELVRSDWESWGDLRLDLDTATVRARGGVGWIAATGTVSQTIGPENYGQFLDFVRGFLDASILKPEDTLRYILRGAASTVYELGRGESFVWPLRFTAVVERDAEGWKFALVHLSYPTVYLPDVRLA